MNLKGSDMSLFFSSKGCDVKLDGKLKVTPN